MATDILWLEEKRKELHTQLQVIEAALAMYHQSNGNITSVGNGKHALLKIDTNQTAFKPIGITLKERTINFVKAAPKFVTSNQIAEVFAAYYPKKKKVDLRVSISSVLSDAKKAGEIVCYSLGESRTLGNGWGLKEWLDEAGMPKPGYEVILEQEEGG